MKDKDLIDLVYELNCLLPDDLLIERGDCSFNLRSSGWQSVILFGDIYLWDNDNDMRPWDEETDDYAISVKDYVIQEFNNIVKLLNTVNLNAERVSSEALVSSGETEG
jgi:hypothetical protein